MFARAVLGSSLGRSGPTGASGLPAAQVPLSRDDVREDHSKEVGRSNGESYRRGRRSGNLVAAVTQAESVVVQRGSAHSAAALELRRSEDTGLDSAALSPSSYHNAQTPHLFINASVVRVTGGGANQQQVVIVTEGQQQGAL